MPPTYAEPRSCGGCDHFRHPDPLVRHMGKPGSCQHPLAAWNWGMDDMAALKKFRRKWPAKAETDWCGYWRPKASEVAS
jgi:hypothetical protein